MVLNSTAFPPANCFPAGRVSAFGRVPGQLVNMHVAGSDHAPGGGNANLAAAKVFFGKTYSAKHRSAGGLFEAVDDLTGVRAIGRVFGAHGFINPAIQEANIMPD